MAEIYNKFIETSKHKRLNRQVKTITVVKKDKTQMNVADILLMSGALLDQNPNKKLMIKVLSDKGFFQLKGYNDSMESIKTEEEYILGREEIGETGIYKVSFYLI